MEPGCPALFVKDMASRMRRRLPSLEAGDPIVHNRQMVLSLLLTMDDHACPSPPPLSFNNIEDVMTPRRRGHLDKPHRIQYNLLK